MAIQTKFIPSYLVASREKQRNGIL